MSKADFIKIANNQSSIVNRLASPQDPASLIVAGPAETLLALFSRRHTDIVGNGAHLPVARAGSYHKIIGGRRYIPQVQNHNIGAMPLCRNPGGSQG